MYPTKGFNVVKGYGAMCGEARLIAESSEDFPALGKPTNPKSEIIFNSSSK
jgi:hypothetical protein